MSKYPNIIDKKKLASLKWLLRDPRSEVSDQWCLIEREHHLRLKKKPWSSSSDNQLIFETKVTKQAKASTEQSKPKERRSTEGKKIKGRVALEVNGYQIIKTLGQGAYSNVYKVCRIRDNQNFACKVIEQDKVSEQYQKSFGLKNSRSCLRPWSTRTWLESSMSFKFPQKTTSCFWSSWSCVRMVCCLKSWKPKPNYCHYSSKCIQLNNYE